MTSGTVRDSCTAVGTGTDQVSRADALSALAWLVDAGVDQLVDERPRDWFAPRAVVRPAAASPPPAAPQGTDFIQALAAANDPAALDALVAEHPASPFRAGGVRPPPQGVLRAEVAVVVDWPTPEDGRDAMLAGGAAGALLDRMLAAIGLERAAVLLTSVVPIVPPGRGRPAPDLLDAGRALLRRRLALGGVGKLLVLGGASQALFDLAPLAARGAWRPFALDEARSVPALVTLAPAFLLSQPAQKARAWEDLQLFVKAPRP